MSKKELFVVAGLIIAISGLNVVNYFRRENLKKNMALIAAETELRISLNEAATRELEELPGIGPVLARRIVEYRDERGRFATVEELLAVKGINRKLLDRITPYIRL